MYWTFVRLTRQSYLNDWKKHHLMKNSRRRPDGSLSDIALSCWTTCLKPLWLTFKSGWSCRFRAYGLCGVILWQGPVILFDCGKRSMEAWWIVYGLWFAQNLLDCLSRLSVSLSWRVKRQGNHLAGCPLWEYRGTWLLFRACEGRQAALLCLQANQRMCKSIFYTFTDLEKAE